MIEDSAVIITLTNYILVILDYSFTKDLVSTEKGDLENVGFD
jgi:hypothetical protein